MSSVAAIPSSSANNLAVRNGARCKMNITTRRMPREGRLCPGLGRPTNLPFALVEPLFSRRRRGFRSTLLSTDDMGTVNFRETILYPKVELTYQPRATRLDFE